MDRVHQLRATCDAILVGVGTVLADDPKLTVKWERAGLKPGKAPLRVVLDGHGRTPATARVLDGQAPTVVYTGGPLPGKDERFVALATHHAGLDLKAVLGDLDARGVKRLLVEGGQGVLTSFLAAGLVDTMSVYVSPRILGLKDAPRLAAAAEDLGLTLRLARTQRMGEGVVLHLERA
jgi:riboflavin-specific deaminase-like protein